MGKIGTLSALLAAAAVSHCAVRNPYMSEVQYSRPEGPEVRRLSANILEINTNGYDVNLEAYLQPSKRTLVELGTYWCTACGIAKNRIKDMGFLFDVDFMLVDLAYPGEDGDIIDSPAFRYLDPYKNTKGDISIPFFLVYDGLHPLGAVENDPNIVRLVRKAKMLE